MLIDSTTVRRDTALAARSKQVRRATLELGVAHGGYHFGGSFSAAEILIALYDTVLRKDDLFLFSKGHACWPWYVLLRERGYEPELAGHPSLDHANGILTTSGSEGHGLPMGLGLALGRKRSGRSGRIFVLMGDGECQEGTTWESLLVGAHHRLDQVTAIVDFNGIQGSGRVDDILSLRSLGAVALAVGWDTVEIDGHAVDQIVAACNRPASGRPRLVIAHTIKGKGVSYMEDRPEWHAKFPTPEQLAQAYQELS